MKCTPFLQIILVFLSTTSVAQTFQKNWENLSGPDGGSILQFETDGEMLYALTYGGIYKSQNAGETWTLLQGSRNVADFSAKLEVTNGLLYVMKGTGEILRSRDLGANWKYVLQEPYSIDSTEAAPNGMIAFGDTLLVITPLGIYRSLDQGETWNTAIVPEYFFAQNFKGFAKIGSDIFVAYSRYILKSKDGGMTWEQNFAASANFADMEAVDSVLYALYDAYPRLIRSYDHGLHWDKIDADSIKFGQYAADFRDWITGQGNKIFYASDYGCIHGAVQMFQSFDNGEEWHQSPHIGLKSHRMRDFKALPQHLLVGTLEGIFRSEDDAVSFLPFHKDMNGTSVYALAKTNTGRWWANTRQGVFSSDDAGETWELRFTGELIDPCNDRWDQYLFTNSRILRIDDGLYVHAYLSTDSGDSWTEIPPISTFWSPQFYASEKTVWMVEHSRLYKLADTDSLFTEIALPAQGYLSDLLVSDEKLMVLIERDKYLSENQGLSWEKIENETPEYQSVGVPFYLDNYALFANSLPFEDTTLVYDFGQKSWKPFYPIVEGDTLNYWEYQFLKTTGKLRWIAVQERGLFYSLIEEPEKWLPFMPILPFNTPTAIEFDLDNQEIWVGTNGAGIYKNALQFEKAESPSLSFGIYPNPSHGKSTLSSPTFFTEKISLRVFDVSGKLLRDQLLPPGQSWDISLDLPNGLYLWQVLTPKGSVSFKWIKME